MKKFANEKQLLVLRFRHLDFYILRRQTRFRILAPQPTLRNIATQRKATPIMIPQELQPSLTVTCLAQCLYYTEII